MLETSLLAGNVSKQTHDAIVKEIENPVTGQAAVKTAARKDERVVPASMQGQLRA